MAEVRDEQGRKIQVCASHALPLQVRFPEHGKTELVCPDCERLTGERIARAFKRSAL